MQRYDFATKWASIVTGVCAVFATVGLLTLVRQDFLFSRLPVCASEASLCSRIGLGSIEVAGFGILFYGCVFIVIGIAILLFEHLKIHTSKEVQLLENQLD